MEGEGCAKGTPMQDAELDNAIVSGKTYADETTYHAIFSRLRREDPVHWTMPERVRPFWTISKHADIMEIERQNERFINDPRIAIASIEDEERVKKFTGGSHHLLRSLVSMDNPDHRAYRGLAQDWFMPKKLSGFEARINALATEFVDKLVALGGACDFAQDIAIWYPLRVIMLIMGIPLEDEARMLKLTQELFGGRDPDTRRSEVPGAIMEPVADFYKYFAGITADRRQNPKDDISSIIANAKIDGKLMGELEAMSYYIIVATAGHDTTSSSTAGGLLALMQNPAELAKLKANPELIGPAVDEMIRWVTPVKHFFRTATDDYELRGRKIKPGEALLMCYPSGNRDEDVFEDPFAFKVDRSPNRHLAFGYGAHLCLGQYLAKIEMRAFYKEFLARVAHVELAGTPAWTEAAFVNGLKRLPIRYRMN
jgi:cytochrome P450